MSRYKPARPDSTVADHLSELSENSEPLFARLQYSSSGVVSGEVNEDGLVDCGSASRRLLFLWFPNSQAQNGPLPDAVKCRVDATAASRPEPISSPHWLNGVLGLPGRP